jgi:hypothetical protein
VRPVVRLLVGVSVLSVLFTLPHVLEDFSAGINERFRLDLLTAGFLVALVYAVQVAGAALSARDRRLGHGLNLAVALFWLFGSVLDHLGEVLFVPNELYRAGAVSKPLEVGIMVVSAVWGSVASRSLRGTPVG